MHGKVYELAIVGAGNMAESIVRGILSAKLIDAGDMIAADPVAARREYFTRELSIETGESVQEAVGGAQVVLLSVKPQQMAAALAAMAESRRADTLFISIAAGIRSTTIEGALGGNVRVIRAMPNTPMLVGAGMTAVCRGAMAGDEDIATARRIFESAGRVVEVEESQMEAVTAVSGSGPAYVFYLAEQMIAAGISLGLSPEQARMLALQTIAGAGRMLVGSPESPEELRKKVTSPGGTTQAAIETMEKLAVGEGVRKAIDAAEKRGQALGN